MYQAASLPDAELFRQRLLNRGIEAVVRNVHLHGAIGELPANLNPEVCVVRDSDYEAAREEVAAMEATATIDGEKACPQCGEDNPINFELCWSCRSEI